MSKETQRPCVVLQKDQYNSTSPNTIVAPITHDEATMSCLIPISDKYDSNQTRILNGKVNVSNTVCISKARLGDPICDLSPSEIKEINNAILRQLDLKNYCFEFEKKYKNAKKYIQKINTELFNLKNILVELRKEANVNTNQELLNFMKSVDKQE